MVKIRIFGIRRIVVYGYVEDGLRDELKIVTNFRLICMIQCDFIVFFSVKIAKFAKNRGGDEKDEPSGEQKYTKNTLKTQ